MQFPEEDLGFWMLMVLWPGSRQLIMCRNRLLAGFPLSQRVQPQG